MSQKSKNLFERFRENLDALLPNGMPSVLVAYSGGADSSVLLHFFHQLASERPIKVYALHLNHNIRRESDEDASFCQSECRRLNISFTLFSEDVPSFAKENGLGIEEAARYVRYSLLERYRKENQIAYIATAHNATDNVETVLFHLARGSSLRGASGIPALTETCLRPLLPFSKSEILAYAKENGIAYCVDASNGDTTYTRNYIRHSILPQLSHINPAYETAFYRFTQDAREDDDALYRIAESYQNCRDTKTLAALDPAILRRVLLIKYRQTAHNEISRQHLLDACKKIALAANKAFSGELSFPDQTVLSISSSEVFFHRIAHTKKIVTPIRLTPDSNFVFMDRYRIVVSPWDTPLSDRALCELKIPKDLLSSISVRSRKDGDRYRSGNMTRSIKKMLCDHKIRADLRDTLPFILYEDTILHILHLPPSDLYRTLSDANGEAYRISIFEV